MKKGFSVEAPELHSLNSMSGVEIICFNPPIPKNGYILPENKTIFQIGETVTFKCHISFYLIGSETTTCMNNGSFAANNASCVTGTFI